MATMRSPTHTVLSPVAEQRLFHASAALPGKIPSTNNVRSESSCDTFKPNEAPSFSKVNVNTSRAGAGASSASSRLSDALTPSGSIPSVPTEASAIALFAMSTGWATDAASETTGDDAGGAHGNSPASASASDNGRCSPIGSCGIAWCAGKPKNAWGCPNGYGITDGKAGLNCKSSGMFDAGLATAVAAAAAAATPTLDPEGKGGGVGMRSIVAAVKLGEYSGEDHSEPSFVSGDETLEAVLPYSAHVPSQSRRTTQRSSWHSARHAARSSNRLLILLA
mmetsp:Transcript_122319/g.351420  ORF Transcript_122319/g.351420 Transcript_122319/m.351420 type:complete len:279 (-) Transcript_122319:275-1111(-)